MTRVNTIPVRALLDQHLHAEYREMPHVIASLQRSLLSVSWDESRIPPRFKLNKGHVMFFYNKKHYLEDRYKRVVRELQRRDYNLSDPHSRMDFSVFDEVSNIKWKPDEDDMLISLRRIIARAKLREGWYRYYGEPIKVSKYKVLALSHINKR